MDEGVRGVLFDIDGTLFDHKGSAVAGLTKWLPTLGLTANAQTVALWFDLEDEFVKQWLDKRVTWQEQRRLRLSTFLEAQGAAIPSRDGLDEEFSQWLAMYRSGWTRYPDVSNALSQLTAAGIPTAILSNGSTEQQKDKLSQIGIADLVGRVLTAEDIGHAKPDPATYLAGCEALELEPSHVLHVGDIYDLDVVGAREAGLRAVQIDRNLSTDQLQDDQINSLTDLMSFIGRSE